LAGLGIEVQVGGTAGIEQQPAAVGEGAGEPLGGAAAQVGSQFLRQAGLAQQVAAQAEAGHGQGATQQVAAVEAGRRLQGLAQCRPALGQRRQGQRQMALDPCPGPDMGRIGGQPGLEGLLLAWGHLAGAQAGGPFDGLFDGLAHDSSSWQHSLSPLATYCRTRMVETPSCAAMSAYFMPSSWLQKNAARALGDRPSSKASMASSVSIASARSSAEGAVASGPCARASR